MNLIVIYIILSLITFTLGYIWIARGCKFRLSVSSAVGTAWMIFFASAVFLLISKLWLT